MTNNYLIIVNVSSTNGKISYKLSTYPDSQPVSGTMNVTPGDSLSWHVQVGIGGVPVPLPYTIAFFEPNGKTPDTEFFGVSSVSVPAGGTSPSLHVRPLQSSIKYSISAPGIGIIFDPVIQTGDGMIYRNKDIAGSNSYAVTWNINTNDMSYSLDGVVQPFPPTLQIKYGDTMSFTATPSTAIQIVFTWDQVTNWVSPFLQRTNVMPTPAANPIAAMHVKDPGDHYAANHGVFPFVLQTANGTQSNSFNLTLV